MKNIIDLPIAILHYVQYEENSSKKLKFCKTSPPLPSPSEAVNRAPCAVENILMLQGQSQHHDGKQE